VKLTWSYSFKQTSEGTISCWFANHIVERLQGKSASKPTVSRNYLAVGLNTLVKKLIYEYKDFNFTKHSKARVQATLQNLVDTSKLDMDKWREDQWI
jgi:hypothetical protein